ncbi:MAG: hypothetical protein OXC62_05060 [Aestuariivita sp.]|nr:hypothetical protein [Aestuariivita sp.]
MGFIDSIPPTVWAVIVLFLLGVIGTFIYKILTIDWRMMDLEPIRKSANEISKIPDDIKSIGNRVGSLETTTAVLEKTTEFVVDKVAALEKTTAALEKTTEIVVNKVDALEKTTETVVNKVDALEKTTAILENTTESISKQVLGLSGQRYTEASSPMSLNDRGRELSKEMGAAEIASKYRAKLVDKARGEDGGPYQIQENCLDCAANEILSDLKEKDKRTFRHLTDIAYNEGVQVEILMRIVGLVLRDQVLQAVNQSS